MKKIDFAIGGQAVIEGVMMRSPSYVTVAVRKKDGSIKVKTDFFKSLTQRIKIFKLPLLRGIVTLFEMMVIGFKALNFSADEYAANFDDEKETKKEKIASFAIASMVVSLVLSLAFAIFLFKFVPLFITEKLRKLFPVIADNYLLFNIIDGIIRISIFLGYVGTLSFFKSFRRIFEYHGAEHMTVHAYEKGLGLTAENVKIFSPRHPRCGTSFIMAVLLLSIVIFSLVPRNPIFWIFLLQRIALLLPIAGIGYEILKWSAKRINSPPVKILVAPGLFTQYITTKMPDRAQIEVAVAALQKALELEHMVHMNKIDERQLAINN